MIVSERRPPTSPAPGAGRVVGGQVGGAVDADEQEVPRLRRSGRLGEHRAELRRAGSRLYFEYT